MINKKEILLSIIIPVYNTAEYLEECVESLIDKKLEYEIIIIDDGSTDESLRIANQLSDKYSMITIIEQENHGQGHARNRGIDIARGKYIFFMDSDDVFEKDGLYKAIQLLEKENLNGLFFDASTFFDEKYVGEKKFKPRYDRKKSYGHYDLGESMLIDLVKDKQYSVSPCLYIIRRDLIIRKEIRFIEGFINEDDSFTTELLLNIQNISHINEKFFKRRIRNGSTMTSSKATKSLLGQFMAFKTFNNLLDNHDFLSKSNKTIFKNIVLNKVINMQRFKPELDGNEIYGKMKYIAKKHNYYNLKGFILIRHLKLYNFVKKLKSKL
ncbi:glycosyltransferase [Aerococcus urinaeequi]